MESPKIIGNAGIKSLIYGSHNMHILLNDDQNIGENGENLTILVLSCNRIESTEKMMNTVKLYISNFKGVFLIVDNGSKKEELDKLKLFIKEVPYKVELVELGENYGVAGGRNKGLKYVKTEWVMSLDNDIYFTMNPLNKIKTTISMLGCKFLNMPLLDESGKKLFVNGGNLFLYNSKNNIHFGGGSLFECTDCQANTEFLPSLGTFIFGGAAVFKKETFDLCGGFDENMFVGFEDYDFSITVFQKGYKVGNLGLICLVHDHKIPSNQSDVEYEKTRFSNTKLKDAAIYFEKKRGFKVWNEETELWIKEKHEKLNIQE
jgi:GT2 family glycosyltransferase